MLITERKLKKIIKSFLNESSSAYVAGKLNLKQARQADLDQGDIENIAGLLGDASELYAAIAEDGKALKVSEDFVLALNQASPELVEFLNSPRIRNTLNKVKALVKFPAIAVKLQMLAVAGEFLAFLLIVLAIPRMAYQVLDNLNTIEGQLKNLKDAPGRKNKGKPLEPEDLADKFTTGGIAKLGIKTKKDLFNILAADVMAPESGKSLGFKMLEDNLISKSFWGEILRARERVKNNSQEGFDALLKKAEQLPKEIKHHAIVLGFITNVIGGLVGVSSKGVQDAVSIKGFPPDDIIKFSKGAYDALK